jgi:hypothetical protein
VRGRVPLGSRAFRSRFKANEATFELPVLSHSALRAGRVPALLPFSSRLFRRTHHTTKQARRWCSLNINKAYIRAHHPRCELCTPCSPCIPWWLVTSTPYRLLSSSLLESHPPDHDEDEQDSDLAGRPTAPSSDSSGFAETERERLAVSTCAALASQAVDRPSYPLGPLEKESLAHSPRMYHGKAEGSAVGSLGKLSQCATRRSVVDGNTADPWHLVDGNLSSTMCSTRCMVRILTASHTNVRVCLAP